VNRDKLGVNGGQQVALIAGITVWMSRHERSAATAPKILHFSPSRFPCFAAMAHLMQGWPWPHLAVFAN
jgi:hypothetical protein